MLDSLGGGPDCEPTWNLGLASRGTLCGQLSGVLGMADARHCGLASRIPAVVRCYLVAAGITPSELDFVESGWNGFRSGSRIALSGNRADCLVTPGRIRGRVISDSSPIVPKSVESNGDSCRHCTDNRALGCPQLRLFWKSGFSSTLWVAGWK